MWPFKKRKDAAQPLPPGPISFSQTDSTQGFDDNVSLAADDWITTTPLNSLVSDAQSHGLPPVGADDDEVYRIAQRLSEFRESMPLPDDGVYCPVCHVANVTLALLRTPCPKCGRPLLQFGWT